jgi:hypothetical protein
MSIAKHAGLVELATPENVNLITDGHPQEKTG